MRAEENSPSTDYFVQHACRICSDLVFSTRNAHSGLLCCGVVWLVAAWCRTRPVGCVGVQVYEFGVGYACAMLLMLGAR
eukprot:14599939-Alexandrium_andersonii.AAC.1